MEASLSESMKERIATIKESFKMPFGTWPMDKNQEEISNAIMTRQYLKSTSLCIVGIIEKTHVYKLYPYSDVPAGSQPAGEEDDSALLRTYGLQRFQHELLMTKLAGECAVPALGRAFNQAGEITGFIMPLQKPITTGPVGFETPTVSPDLSLVDRKRIIRELVDLVDKLHEKEIVHGDINPTNLLHCSDGKLRLCDFQASSPVGVIRPPAFTVEYLSPTRNRAQLSGDFSPLSFADDLYATGVSIWAIYTGCAPFSDVPSEPEEMLEDVIAAGVRPDISKIGDEGIKDLVTSYLDRGCGEDSLAGGVIRQARDTCIAANVEFGDCRANPRHTYGYVLHAASCNVDTSSQGSCVDLYQASGVARLTEPRRPCSQCQ